MNEPTASSPHRSRWTWRFLIAGLIVLAAIWPRCFIVHQDSLRANAVQIYEAVNTNMRKDQVLTLMKEANVDTSDYDYTQYFVLSNFYFEVCFDKDGNMYRKSVL